MMTKVLFVCWDGLTSEDNIVNLIRSIFSSNRIGDGYKILSMEDIEYSRRGLEILLTSLRYNTYGDRVVILVDPKNIDLMLNLFMLYILQMYQDNTKGIDIRTLFIESTGMPTEDFLDGLMGIKKLEDVKEAIKNFRHNGKVTKLGPLLETITAPLHEFHIHQAETHKYEVLTRTSQVDLAMYNFLRWFYEDNKEYVQELDRWYNQNDE